MPSLLIIYDGACPFYSSYVSLLRLRSDFAVELLSARSADARIAHYHDLGYRLDDGMLAVLDGQVSAGADAMHLLASLSERRGVLNRLQRAVFSIRSLSRCLYPWLRMGRRFALWTRGVRMIDPPKGQP